MSKDNIAQQYNNMVASIEDAKIYDGRGEYNLYECNKCNNYKVTLYKDKGVTPFIMRCKCGGDMMHTKSSKQAPPSYVKVHNWVRPSLEQTMKGEYFLYCILMDFKESFARVNYWKSKSRRFLPHCQPFRDLNNPHQIIPQWQKDMAHWADRKEIYMSCDFKDFSPRKGFLCKEYFKIL